MIPKSADTAKRYRVIYFFPRKNNNGKMGIGRLAQAYEMKKDAQAFYDQPHKGRRTLFVLVRWNEILAQKGDDNLLDEWSAQEGKAGVDPIADV